MPTCYVTESRSHICEIYITKSQVLISLWKQNQSRVNRQQSSAVPRSLIETFAIYNCFFGTEIRHVILTLCFDGTYLAIIHVSLVYFDKKMDKPLLLIRHWFIIHSGDQCVRFLAGMIIIHVNTVIELICIYFYVAFFCDDNNVTIN